MKKEYSTIIFLSLLLFVTVLAKPSGIKVTYKGKTTSARSVEIRSIKYVSTKDLAKAFSANYYYSPKHQKSEIKFKNYKLKFTANNQFVILTSKQANQHQVFQLPISSRIGNNDVFIPMKFCTKYLSLASEKKITFNKSKNEVLVLDKDINTNSAVVWNKEIIDRSTLKYDIFSAKIEPKANGTLIRFRTKNEIRKPSSSIKDNTLYLFFSGITVNKNKLKNLKPLGLVKSIKTKYVKGNPQIEIKLKNGFDKYEVFYDEEIGELLVSIHNKFTNKKYFNNKKLDKWNFKVIVLDAGHGGKDPGTIGIKRIKEKNINLAIVKELGKLLETKMKDVKVVYTRKKDKFVELYKRGKIANEHHGNLFISIHCNSMPKKPSKTRGFEVYLLRPGRTKEAINIAEFENSVISMEDDPSRYKKLNDENFILVSMANASNVRYSESFADMLNTEWIKTVDIPSRGIKQAGFYVLVGAAMPAVLIETGYLSNKKDAAFLNTTAGRKKIAKAIFNGIAKYKKYYETSINSDLQ